MAQNPKIDRTEMLLQKCKDAGDFYANTAPSMPFVPFYFLWRKPQARELVGDVVCVPWKDLECKKALGYVQIGDQIGGHMDKSQVFRQLWAQVQNIPIFG